MSRQKKEDRRSARDVLNEYLLKLEAYYPQARGETHISRRQDDRIIVSVPLPEEETERMQLFDYMAEVGTELLVETDQYIILSSR